MKKTTSLLYFICFILTVHAQSYYINGFTTSLQPGNNLKSVCMRDSNSFVAVGYDVGVTVKKGFVIHFDKFANILQVLAVDTLYFEKVLKTSDEHFLFISHTATSGVYYCTKTDINFNIAWTKRLPAEVFLIKEFNNEYYFFTKSQYLNIELMTKTDTTGNILSQKPIEIYFSYGYIIDDAALTSDNDIMIIGREKINLSGSPYWCILSKVDTNLNVIWMKELNGYYDNYPSRINRNNDGTFIISGAFDIYLQYSGLGVIKVDTAGSVLLSRLNRPTYPDHSIISVSSNFMTGNCANIVCALEMGPGADINGILAKYDSSLNYVSSYACFPSRFDLSDISELNSGRFFGVGAGAAISGNIQVLMGLDTSLQTCSSQPYLMNDTLTTLTTLDIALTNPVVSPYNLVDTALSFQNLPVTIYNYCQMVSTDNFEHVSSNLYVSPNPTHGQVGISSEFIGKEICIYNVYGEKIYSAVLKDENIELNAKAGIYFVKVSDGERVWTQKVVIE